MYTGLTRVSLFIERIQMYCLFTISILNLKNHKKLMMGNNEEFLKLFIVGHKTTIFTVMSFVEGFMFFIIIGHNYSHGSSSVMTDLCIIICQDNSVNYTNFRYDIVPV